MARSCRPAPSHWTSVPHPPATLTKASSRPYAVTKGSRSDWLDWVPLQPLGSTQREAYLPIHPWLEDSTRRRPKLHGKPRSNVYGGILNSVMPWTVEGRWRSSLSCPCDVQQPTVILRLLLEVAPDPYPKIAPPSNLAKCASFN